MTNSQFLDNIAPYGFSIVVCVTYSKVLFFPGIFLFHLKFQSYLLKPVL